MKSEYNIAVIGAGGLGITACLGLLELFDNKTKIKIFDHDKIEVSNLNRQVYFSYHDVNQYKSEVLAKKLESANVTYSICRINKDNIKKELLEFDIILDATDSVRTSFLLNDFCIDHLKYFSYAGVIADYGQTLFYNPNIDSACLRCIFEDWKEEDYDKIEKTCQSSGVIGPIAGLVGYIQAETIYNSLLNNSSKFIRYSNTEKEIKLAQNTQCKCNRETIEIDLSSKSCPQTFILSKLAIENLEKKQKILLNFKNEDSALKTYTSLKSENVKVNKVSNNKLLACN